MNRWNRRKYTQEEFKNAWLTSESISEVARKLNCNRSGGGFYTLKNAAKEMFLTQDHMASERTQRSNRTWKKKHPLNEILIQNSTYVSTNQLKKKLYSEGLKEKKCEWCQVTEWRGLEAPLVLDHINGIRQDNRIENLRILCCNCHAQTETYAGKNIKKKKKDVNRCEIYKRDN